MQGKKYKLLFFFGYLVNVFVKVNFKQASSFVSPEKKPTTKLFAVADVASSS